MMPKANPDVILRVPQTQFQAVQTRLTDYLLQSQYAFMQSFSDGLDTTFDIFIDFELSPASTLESVQLALYPAPHSTSIAVTLDSPLNMAPQSAHMVNLMECLAAVCRQ